MPLLIWTASDTQLLKKTFGPALQFFRPNIPEHKFISWKEEDPVPEPEEGDVILVCGNKPLETMRREGLVQKNRTLNSLREQPIKRGAGHYLVTFDAYSIMTEPEKNELLAWDVRLATRIMRTGSAAPVVGSYKWVNDYQPTIDWIEEQFAKTGKPVDVACDTETMGFYPWYQDKDILSISFTAKPYTAEVLYLGPQKHPIDLDPNINLFDQIKWLLTSKKVKTRFSNGKYDLIWIGEKWGIECTNFKFDNMLVGTLLDENLSNGLSTHTKVYTDMGGYDCVGLGTRLLTDDLLWRPVEDFAEGDRLLAFDEEPVAGNKTRRLREAVVEATKVITKPCMKITLDNGVSIVCSTDHMFLAVARSVERGGWCWRRAHDLRLGSKLRLGMPPILPGDDFDSGWMSGFLDGEGYVSKNGCTSVAGDSGFLLGWSQKPGPVHDRACRIMQDSGFPGFGITGQNGGTYSDVITVKCGQWPAMGALVKFRPIRLLGKKPWLGATIPAENAVNGIVALEYVGEQPVVALKTSTSTFIAEGVCSHNSAFDAKVDKGQLEKALPDEDYLTYAGGDTDAAQRVADYLRDQLAEDPQLAKFYITILHPAARAFEKIERRGVCVDQEKLAVLREDLKKVIKENQDKALSILPNKMRIKYRDRIDDQLAAGKNPLLPSILHDFFFTTHGLNLKPKMTTAKTGKPSMAKAHLRQFADVPAAVEMVSTLTEMDTASKTLSTFVEGFLKHLRPDGKFHPTYFLGHAEFEGYDDDDSGTVTGRLSAKNPPFQIIPKKTKWAKRIRECYPAPTGKVVLVLDYSQGELKVVACVANEKTMIQAYQDGLDLHALTGARLAQVDVHEFLKWKDSEDAALAAAFEKSRTNAKPANFGLLYGMQVEGFRQYAWTNYGIKLTFEEAENMRNAFFELYPGLLDYHEKQRKIVAMHEQVRSPLGRIRHLPMIRSWDREIKSKAERMGINSPIQSTLTDMMCWAIALIEDAYPNAEAEIVGQIHDALVAYVPEQEATLWAVRFTEIMSNLPFHELGWKPVLKFTADAEAGNNLAELKKLKLST